MVKSMKIMNVFPAVVFLAVAACGADVAEPAAEVEVAASEPTAEKSKPAAQFDGTVSKIGAPFSISYKIIGTPVVGSPIAVELRVMSSIETPRAQLSYSIPDDSSMVLHEAQPQTVDAEFAANERWLDQRVTVVPTREGRIYLNVSASADADDGRISTTMAVPIQVGAGSRELEDQGELGTDEDGEAIRILTND